MPGPGDGMLSFAQRRMWFLDQLAPGRAGYLVTFAYELAGPLDEDLLERSLRLVADRHEVLRGRVVMRGGEPWWAYDPAEVIRLERVDLTGSPGAALADAALADAALREAAGRPCDLAAGPLLRATIIRLGEHRFLFQYAAHHIVFDGPSRVIFERELSASYAALAAGTRPGLAPLALRYSEHAEAEQGAVLRGELASQEEYWAGQLRDAPVLSWPADRDQAGGREPGHAGAGTEPVEIGPDVFARLADLAAAERTSVFVIALAAYQYLLGYMTGLSDVLVGVPLAGRTDPDLEQLIGFFTNTAVLRADLTGSPTLRDLVRQARDTVLDALDNQDVPFDRIVDALGIKRDSQLNPLFQHWFGYSDGELVRQHLALPGVSCVPLELPVETSRFDTELELVAVGRRIAGEFRCASHLSGSLAIKRFAARYQRLLAQASRLPDARLSSIELVGPAERRELADLAAGRQYDEPTPDIDAWFTEQVSRTPEAIAVADGGTELTYRQLDDAAARLAAVLLEAGVGDGHIVAIIMPRCSDMVVAMLAAVRAGAAYLPIGADLPPQRVTYLLSDSGASAVLTRRGTPVPEPAPRLIAVDDPACRPPGRPPAQAPGLPATRPSPRDGDHLMYVVYTSGSTGLPKGVAVSRRQFGGLVRWHLRTYRPGPGDRIAQIASLAFDAAEWEIWPALLSGACLVICPGELIPDPAGLADWLAGNGIAGAFAPTPLAEQLIREKLGRLTRLRYLLTGGDLFRPRPDDDPGVPVMNHYGPTENAVVATATGGLRAPWDGNSIGRPVDGVRAYLADRELRLVPHGVIGELCLGGSAVAWGYWRRAGLTAGRFVPDPFSPVPGARMYRTGDLARWRPDGTLHFAGRLDDQLEVNGYRIEPGEIEAQLLTHPSVRTAAVAARRAPSGERVLVAYVMLDQTAAGPGPGPDELRAHLAARLPRYLMPQVFAAVAALPLTTSGKVDRARLPELASAQDAPTPPRTDVERVMCRLWSEVLDIQDIGAYDDFFALGGNSMSATRLLARIRSTFGIDFALRAIFDHSSVAALSLAVTEQVRAEIADMTAGEITAALSGSPANGERR